MDRSIRSKVIEKKNIFATIDIHKIKSEIFEDIISSRVIKIERIISKGQVTPKGKWLSGKMDEWVVLLKGKAGIYFRTGEKINLTKGDYFLIKSNTKHRITFTSKRPECIWLAIHGKLTN